MPRKKQCLVCSSTDLYEGYTTIHQTLAGVVYNIQVPALLCPNCPDEARISEKVVDAYERALAQRVAQGPEGGDAMRFLRKWSDVTALELARLLSTTPETISRWEKEVHPVPSAVFWIVSKIAQDRLSGHQNTIDSLQLRCQAPKKNTIEFTVT